MKAALLVSSLFFSQISFGQTKIIKYAFGNQVTGSTLVVNSDGIISHGERTCCPPRTDHVTHTTLAKAEVVWLNLLVEGAELGSQSTFGIGQSGPGSSAGHLVVYGLSDKKTNIRTIEFGNGSGSPQPVDFNTAEEAREIEKFVFENVVRKMPY